jgi:hypothetical protein
MFLFWPIYANNQTHNIAFIQLLYDIKLNKKNLMVSLQLRVKLLKNEL